ncbi:hypothetical protein TH62_10885 [Bacillus sp. TH008]|nr:hypothetical protein TH62_10885 [Bacillus sp. TH008]
MNFFNKRHPSFFEKSIFIYYIKHLDIQCHIYEHLKQFSRFSVYLRQRQKMKGFTEDEAFLFLFDVQCFFSYFRIF